MYQAHFGLTKSLFDGGIAQDAAVFHGAQQKLIAANFAVALTTQDSAVVLTGAAGVGKTTLTSAALRTISTRLALGWLNGTPANGGELLELLLSEFGFNAHRVGRVERLQMWRQFLNEMNATDSRVFVIAERADDLGPEVLRAAEALTASDPNGCLGANLVLLGHPGFIDTLKSPMLDALRQRVRLRQRLEPLRVAELRDYLAHHVALAGGSLDTVFTSDAVEALHRCSDGIPRTANNVCETALTLAATEGTRPITAELVARVADLFGLDTAPAAAAALAPAPPPAPAPATSTRVAFAKTAAATLVSTSVAVAPTPTTVSEAPLALTPAAAITTAAAPAIASTEAIATATPAPASTADPMPTLAPAARAVPIEPAPAADSPVTTTLTPPAAATVPTVAISAPAHGNAATPSDDSFAITTVDTPDVAIIDFPILTDAVETPDFRATATAVEEDDPSIAALARQSAVPTSAPPTPRTNVVEPVLAPAATRGPIAPPAAHYASPPHATTPPASRIPTPIPPASIATPRTAAAPPAPSRTAAATAQPTVAGKRSVPLRAPAEDEEELHQTQTMRALASAKSIDDISSSMAETLFGDEDLDMLSAALGAAGWSEEPQPAARSAASKASEPEPTADPFDFFNLGPDAPLELIDDSESPTDRTRKTASKR